MLQYQKGVVHKLGFFTFIHHEIDFGSKMNAKVNNQSKQWQNNREQISRQLPIELSVLITQLFESGVNICTIKSCLNLFNIPEAKPVL